MFHFIVRPFASWSNCCGYSYWGFVLCTVLAQFFRCQTLVVFKLSGLPLLAMERCRESWGCLGLFSVGDFQKHTLTKTSLMLLHEARFLWPCFFKQSLCNPYAWRACPIMHERDVSPGQLWNQRFSRWLGCRYGGRRGFRLVEGFELNLWFVSLVEKTTGI